MKRLIRHPMVFSLIFAAAATVGSAQALWACAPYISGSRGSPYSGYLIGKKSVTLSFGIGSTFITETFEVGTYMDDSGGTISVRCDTYRLYRV